MEHRKKKDLSAFIMEHGKNHSKNFHLLRFFMLYALCSLVWSSPLFAQTDSIIIRTSDSAAEIARLTVTTSTASGAQAYIYTTLSNFGIGTTAPTALLHVTSTTSGDCEVILEADTDDSNEADNAFITFKQDNNTVNAFIGLEGAAGTRSTNTLADAFLIGSEDDTPAIQFVTSDAVRMTVEPGGHIGIGTNDPTSELTVYGNFTIGSASGSTFALTQPNVNGDSSDIHSDEDSDTQGFVDWDMGDNSFFRFNRETMHFYSSDTAIIDGDVLGTIEFAGTDDGDNLVGAKIIAEAAGTWDGADADDAPTDMMFYTQSDGTTDDMASPRMTIESDGDVGIGTNEPGALLEILQNTSNTSTVDHLMTITGVSTGTTAANFGTGILFRFEENGGTLQDGGAIDVEWQTTAVGEESRIAISSMEANHDGNLVRRLLIGGTQAGLSAGIGGTLTFLGENSAGESENLARIDTYWTNYNDGAEASDWIFSTRTGGGALTEQMRITHAGNVGINTNNPTYLFDLEGSNTTSAIGELVNTSTDTGGKQILQISFAADATISANDDFIQFHNSDGEVGSIHSELTYGTFTGSHDGQTEEDPSNWKQGMILCSTGKIMPDQSMGRALVQVRLATRKREKAAIGVFVVSRFPHEVSGFDRSRPVITYNAVGEGLILVTDSNGNIKVGDFITTSSRAGYGELQGESIFRNYTVAKSTEIVNWDEVKVDPELSFKWKLVACTYHSG